MAFRSMVAGILLALIATSGTGCGQRGPLYLPDAESAADGPAESRPGSAGERGTDESPDSEDTE